MQHIDIDTTNVLHVGLQNDHKSIMKLIEEKIHQLHEEARRKKVSSEGTLHIRVGTFWGRNQKKKFASNIIN